MVESLLVQTNPAIGVPTTSHGSAQVPETSLSVSAASSRIASWADAYRTRHFRRAKHRLSSAYKRTAAAFWGITKKAVKNNHQTKPVKSSFLGPTEFKRKHDRATRNSSLAKRVSCVPSITDCQFIHEAADLHEFNPPRVIVTAASQSKSKSPLSVHQGPGILAPPPTDTKRVRTSHPAVSAVIPPRPSTATTSATSSVSDNLEPEYEVGIHDAKGDSSSTSSPRTIDFLGQVNPTEIYRRSNALRASAGVPLVETPEQCIRRIDGISPAAKNSLLLPNLKRCAHQMNSSLLRDVAQTTTAGVPDQVHHTNIKKTNKKTDKNRECALAKLESVKRESSASVEQFEHPPVLIPGPWSHAKAFCGRRNPTDPPHTANTAGAPQLDYIPYRPSGDLLDALPIVRSDNSDKILQHQSSPKTKGKQVEIAQAQGYLTETHAAAMGLHDNATNVHGRVPSAYQIKRKPLANPKPLPNPEKPLPSTSVTIIDPFALPFTMNDNGYPMLATRRSKPMEVRRSSSVLINPARRTARVSQTGEKKMKRTLGKASRVALKVVIKEHYWKKL